MGGLKSSFHKCGSSKRGSTRARNHSFVSFVPPGISAAISAIQLWNRRIMCNSSGHWKGPKIIWENGVFYISSHVIEIIYRTKDITGSININSIHLNLCFWFQSFDSPDVGTGDRVGFLKTAVSMDGMSLQWLPQLSTFYKTDFHGHPNHATTAPLITVCGCARRIARSIFGHDGRKIWKILYHRHLEYSEKFVLLNFPKKWKFAKFGIRREINISWSCWKKMPKYIQPSRQSQIFQWVTKTCQDEKRGQDLKREQQGSKPQNAQIRSLGIIRFWKILKISIFFANSENVSKIFDGSEVSDESLRLSSPVDWMLNSSFGFRLTVANFFGPHVVCVNSFAWVPWLAVAFLVIHMKACETEGNTCSICLCPLSANQWQSSWNVTTEK